MLFSNSYIPSKGAISKTYTMSCTDVTVLRVGSYELKNQTRKRAALPNFIYKVCYKTFLAISGPTAVGPMYNSYLFRQLSSYATFGVEQA